MLIIYILGLGVLHDHLIVLFQSNIYIYHFCLYFAFFLSLLLINLLFFLNHVVSLIRLRLNVTQEVPFSPFINNRSCHIEGNVDLGWGKSKRRKF